MEIPNTNTTEESEETPHSDATEVMHQISTTEDGQNHGTTWFGLTLMRT